MASRSVGSNAPMCSPGAVSVAVAIVCVATLVPGPARGDDHVLTFDDSGRLIGTTPSRVEEGDTVVFRIEQTHRAQSAPVVFALDRLTKAIGTVRRDMATASLRCPDEKTASESKLCDPSPAGTAPAETAPGPTSRCAEHAPTIGPAGVSEAEYCRFLAEACHRVRELARDVRLPATRRQAYSRQIEHALCQGVEDARTHAYVPAAIDLLGGPVELEPRAASPREPSCEARCSGLPDVDAAPAVGAQADVAPPNRPGGYTVDVECIDDAGAAIGPPSTVALRGTMLLEGCYAVSSRCAALSYRVRRARPWARAIESWFTRPGPVSLARVQAHAAVVQQAWRALDEARGARRPSQAPPLPVVRGEKADEAADVSGKLAAALRVLERSRAAHDGPRLLARWAASWLWATGGRPMLGPTDPSLRKTRQTLQADIAKLDARIKVLSDLLAAPTARLRLGDRLPQTVEALGEMRARRAKAAEELKKGDVAFRADRAMGESDAFLHSGRLVMRVGGAAALMRHHDPTRGDAIIDATPTHEVARDEVLVVLVANGKSKASGVPAVSTTPMTDDAGHLTLQALRRMPGVAADAPITNVDTVGAQVALDGPPPNGSPGGLPIVHELLQPGHVPARKDDTGASSAELQRRLRSVLRHEPSRTVSHSFVPYSPRRPGRTPRYVSRPEVVERPAAPAVVAYSITVPADEGQPERAIEGEFRQNEGYRMRLKTGFAYSWRDAGTVGDAGAEDDETSSTQTTRTAGLDLTVGVQFYLGPRRDIRADGLFWYPVVYGGISVIGPLSDLYFGAGLEPFNGLTVMGGLNVGATQALDAGDGGVRTIEEKWNTGLFAGVTLDPLLFAQFFGFDIEI